MSSRRDVTEALESAGFKCHTFFTPAFDKRDPDPAKNYGIGGLRLYMVLVGPLGAVQFWAFLPIYTPDVQKEQDQRVLDKARNGRLDVVDLRVTYHVNPADVGYHSPTPKYDSHTTMGPCEWLAGRECYYDGSGLHADEVWPKMLHEGSEGMWRYLAEYYDETFDTTTGKDAVAQAVAGEVEL